MVDENFSAKVADFGFVTPLLENVGSTSVMTVAGAVGLAGTKGYLAPEYSDGKRGAKSDVYSYGIVSVEIHIIGASRSEPHTNQYYEKITVHIYLAMYVAICCPRVHHARACTYVVR